MIGDVDSLQGLYLRGLGPPLVALAVGAAAVGVTAAFLPQAAAVLALGLLVAGVAVPLLSGALARAAADGGAPPRASSTPSLSSRCAVRPSSSRTAARTTSNAASALWTASPASRVATRSSRVSAGTLLAACGLTVVGVLAVSVTAHDTGTLDRVLVATLRVARARLVRRCPASARGRTGADGGRRVRAPAASSSPTASPRCATPGRRSPRRRLRPRLRSRT